MSGIAEFRTQGNLRIYESEGGFEPFNFEIEISPGKSEDLSQMIAEFLGVYRESSRGWNLTTGDSADCGYVEIIVRRHGRPA